MEVIFKIGGLAGLISVLWLLVKETVTFLRRPRLELLTFDSTKDLRVFKYRDTGWVRKFANVHIQNSKVKVAMNCVATLSVVSAPPNVVHLERQYYLHWGDVEHSYRTTEPQPINLGRGQRRLDVVFTQENQKLPGCWITVPLALSQASPGQNQAYLPPGEYEVEIVISSDNGRGDKGRYRITSPTLWSSLDMAEMKR